VSAEPQVDASSISPVPTDEEAAVIVSAVEAMWPRAAAGAEVEAERHTAWRFSGRWWARPLPTRRARPFR
jgi:hypothetical protein